RGRRNLAAALDIALEHFPNPTHIVLSGASAGGYGTLSAMLAVRLAYPNAQLFVINDSGPGIQNLAQSADVEARLDQWRFADLVPASCVDCQAGRGQLTPLYAWMLERDPTLQIALLSYYEDPSIGKMFLRLEDAAFKELLLAETGKVQAAFPDRFRRFLLTGTLHVVGWGADAVSIEGTTPKGWITGMFQAEPDTWKDLLGP
ncbi:MAG TPA: hypothetical protein VK524_28790, partial [Polyangiaceae bacterium]|nr:hypothetical protein [Polyangiaceae bacterium]